MNFVMMAISIWLEKIPCIDIFESKKNLFYLHVYPNNLTQLCKSNLSFLSEPLYVKNLFEHIRYM